MVIVIINYSAVICSHNSLIIMSYELLRNAKIDHLTNESLFSHIFF